MNKKNINIVIGANYGDEGKGLVTNWLSNQYSENDSIIILNNGGAQRGHTVEDQNEFRHVFHHFGSTTNKNYISYCSQFFIINPAIWFIEKEELKYTPQLYIDQNCLVSTPFDMLLNQMMELNRAENEKHGSVGVGIWETICRNKYIPLNFSSNKYHTPLFKKLILTYFQQRIEQNNIQQDIIDNLLTGINLDELYLKFVDDFHSMQTIYKNCSITDIYKKFNNIIIENGQGLLLDQSLNTVHTTPSNTGIKNLNNLVCKNYNNIVNCYYVSRTYLTRHGNGPLENEIDKKELSKDINIDQTNIYNDYQGNIRYGKLNIDELIQRIQNDYIQFKGKINTKNLVLTHCNELNMLVPQNILNNVYYSYNPFNI